MSVLEGFGGGFGGEVGGDVALGHAADAVGDEGESAEFAARFDGIGFPKEEGVLIGGPDGTLVGLDGDGDLHHGDTGVGNARVRGRENAGGLHFARRAMYTGKSAENPRWRQGTS